MKRTWHFSIANGEPHTLTVGHTFTDKFYVILDGQEEYRGKGDTSYSFRYARSVHGMEYDVTLIDAGFPRTYALIVDNEVVPATGHRSKHLNAYATEILRIKLLLLDIAARTGLRYLPHPQWVTIDRHRLVGRFNGYLVGIRYQMATSRYRVSGKINDFVPVCVISIRHEKVEEPDALKAELQDAPVLNVLQEGYSLANGLVRVNPTVTEFILPNGLDQPNGQVMAEKVNRLVELVSQYEQPSPVNRCDDPDCVSPSDASTKLVFLNGAPYNLCTECLKRKYKQVEGDSRSVVTSPSKQAIRIGYGVVVALAGTLLMGLMSLILDNQILMFIGIPLLIANTKIIQPEEKQRRFGDLLIALGLSLSGIILGAYLSTLFSAINDQHGQFTAETWLVAWRFFTQPAELLLRSTGWCIVTSALLMVRWFIRVYFETKPEKLFIEELETD